MYISGTRLDDRIIRGDWDAGFVEGRQYGRGRSGGQVCRSVQSRVHCVTRILVGEGVGGVNKGLPIGGLHLYRQKSNFILVSITNKFNM